MFIQTEPTPNPEVLKFIPGPDVAGDGASHDFTSIEAAQASPLAEALFQIEGVKRVFFGSDFLTVTKHGPQIDWAQVKAPALAAIMDHYQSGQPLIRDGSAPPAEARPEIIYEGETAQIVAEIKELLETRIRPAVAQDGGDIVFDRFEADTGVLYLHMQGACAGCPSSSATLKAGVENLMRHYVPEVTAVEQVY